MKKALFIMASLLLIGSVAQADPFGGLGNINPGTAIWSDLNRSSVYDIQQLQNQYRSEKGSFSEFKDFKQQQKENQERVQRDIDRQKALEERAQYGSQSHTQFVNDNGVIKIESY